MSPQAILTLALLSILVGALAGFIVGRARGRDEQWCDDYLAATAKDRARRNAQGQFKPKASA